MRLCNLVVLSIFFALCAGCDEAKVRETTLVCSALDGVSTLEGITLPLADNAQPIATAREISLILSATSSGEDMAVDLVLANPDEVYTQAELARAALAAAIHYNDYVEKRTHAWKTRPIRANIHQVSTLSEEHDVLLATAALDLRSTNDLTYPGPAWIDVKAAERSCKNEIEIKYIQHAQLKRHTWGIHTENQEDIRSMMSAEQDEEVSKMLGINPGSIELVALELRDLREGFAGK